MFSRSSVTDALGRVTVASSVASGKAVGAASSHGRPGGLSQRLGERGTDDVVDERRRVRHPLDSHHLADSHRRAARLGHRVDDVGERQRQPERHSGDQHGARGAEQVQLVTQRFVRQA